MPTKKKMQSFAERTTNLKQLTEQEGKAMEETIKNEKKVYEASDIMEILGIGRSKAYEFLREVCDSETPPFQVIKIGRLVRVPKKSFDEWLDKAYGGMV